MFLQQRADPEFFRRKPEMVGPDGKAITTPIAPTSREGPRMAGEVIVGSRDPSRCTALGGGGRRTAHTAGVASLRSALLLGLGPQHARRGTAD
jgi:hypothetical protein